MVNFGLSIFRVVFYVGFWVRIITGFVYVGFWLEFSQGFSMLDFGYTSAEVLWMSISISVLRGQGRAQRGRRPLDMLGLFLRVSSNAKRVHVSLLHS